MQSLVTSRYVLQSFLDELLEFDRDIPVARNVQVGDVADALDHLLRLTASSSSVFDDGLAPSQPQAEALSAAAMPVGEPSIS